MNKPTSIAEKFYLKYEWMATSYANQIFNFERHGYQRQDLIQELRIKIYTSVLTYARKWQEYKETGRYKPVPIKFYIKSALVNRTKDFIKQFNQETVENVEKVSLDCFDWGIFDTYEMDNENHQSGVSYKINGIDLFEGCKTKLTKVCFSLYLRGYSIPRLIKIFPKLEVAEIIEKQVDFLRTKKTQLFDHQTETYRFLMFEESNNN